MAHDDGWSIRGRRTRADWAGITMGDAFKPDLDFYARLAAQRLFYAAARRVQRAAARAAGESDDTPRARPQISAFYTGYPLALAAPAALGHTGYVEFESRIK